MRPGGGSYAHLDEAELVALFRARDAGAVRYVATCNNQRLFRAAWAVLRDSAEAEDAVQSAYLKAFAAIDTFEGRSKLSTWLTRIVINEARVRRRSARRRAALLGHAMPPGTDIGEEVDTAYQTPEQHVANVQLRKALEQALGSLPQIYRTVFILREIEGMTVEETAAALDILPATVKTRLFRARHMLQARLSSLDRTAVKGVLAFGGKICAALTARVLLVIAA
ncbi:RNA polymerase sigma factor [Novosphingobium sp. AAP93]|uniref:RNA polymerase sigma factor n=1 Tax=Novosphingobium sp. AAP93 TaxID=1523427 RepID=UPI0009E78541|nr:RNA polymerase sigma factor [Novosphingobium sp. AAP93]